MARLIALLAVLLVAASPSPRHHHQAYKTQTTEEKSDGSPSPISTPSNQLSPKPSPASSGNYTYNYYYPAIKSESPPVWFQELTTFILILFTGGLWWTSVRQWRALKEQAGVAEKAVKAAEESARVAHLALSVERPYVFIEAPKMVVHAEPLTYPVLIANIGASVFGPAPVNPLRFEISYELRNRGKGIAIVDMVRARCHLSRTIWGGPTGDERRQGRTRLVGIRDRVIGPMGVSRNCRQELYLGQDTWNKILPHTIELSLLGYVRFHDVFDNCYRQDFCYRYVVGSFDAQTLHVDVDWFFAGPPKNNKYHRCKNTGLSEPE